MPNYKKEELIHDIFQERQLYDLLMRQEYEQRFWITPVLTSARTDAEPPACPHSDSPQLLYHYTSLQSFMKIMTSGCLWASNIHFLNDRREYEDGRQICLQVIKGYTEETISPAARRELGLLYSLIEENRPDNIMNWSVENIFSTSFCKEGDLLSQWRGYGQNSGVAIGFDLQALRGAVIIPESKYRFIRDHKISFRTIEDSHNSPSLQIPSEAKWVQVEYSFERKQAHFKDMLKNFLTFLDSEDGYKNREAKTPEYFANLHAHLLRMMFPIMKNEGFQEENECRMIANYTEDDMIDISYRTAGGLLVPYVNFRLLDGSGAPFETVLPVKKIIVGPGQEQEMTAKSIRYFLTHQAEEEQKGLKELADMVCLSDIPFR